MATMETNENNNMEFMQACKTFPIANSDRIHLSGSLMSDLSIQSSK